MNFDIITELDEYRVLRDEIETILADFPDSFFFNPSRLTPFQQVLSSDREVMHIIGRRPDGSITGFVDMSVVRTSFLKMLHPRVLAFLGTRSVVSPEHLDFAIKRRSRDNWFDFLSRFLATGKKPIAFRYGFIVNGVYYVFPPGLKANIYADAWRIYHGLERNGR